MTEIIRSIQIRAPIEKVFKYASDYHSWPEFYVGLSEFKPITETTHGNGTQYIYKAKMFGMKSKVGTEITEFKENEGWIGKSFKGLEHKTIWIFKRLESDTEFTHGLIYKIHWYLGGNWIDKKFFQVEWVRIIEKSLQNLKQIMETT
jgi:uncharacterized membrane protein